jgi:hypothetical protein
VVTQKWERAKGFFGTPPPVWTLRVEDVTLEIRDVVKNEHAHARTGWDDTARYNLWVGHSTFPVNVSTSYSDLAKWAIANLDRLLAEYREKR